MRNSCWAMLLLIPGMAGAAGVSFDAVDINRDAGTNPAVAMFVLLVANVAYSLLSVLSVAAVAICTPRIEKPWALLGAALVNPLYKEVLRWVRFRATVCELLRIRYEDTFLPMSAWVHAKRY